MFDKLLEAQKKAEEIKRRLESISVSADVEGGKIKVTATANKKITEIFIAPDLLNEGDHDQIAELLATAVNKALDQAESIGQAEMQAATRDMMGGFGNFFNK